MAYTSKIDLGGLGEIPRSRDNETFPDFVDVYNAIHVLAQYVDMLVTRTEEESDKGPDKAPWELMPFTNWIWVPAAVQIASGQVISSVNWEYNSTWSPLHGAVLGAGTASFNYFHRPEDPFYPGSMIRQYTRGNNVLIGIALEDADVGELVKFGIGPAIIQVPGIVAGNQLFARLAASAATSWSSPEGYRWELKNDGGVYLDVPFDNTEYVAIGYGVANDAAIIMGPTLTPGYNRIPTKPLEAPL